MGEFIYRPAALKYDELYRRIKGVPLSAGQQEAVNDLKDGACILGAMILELTPPSPEQTLATRALEEAVMWSTKAIAQHRPEPVVPSGPSL